MSCIKYGTQYLKCNTIRTLYKFNLYTKGTVIKPCRNSEENIILEETSLIHPYVIKLRLFSTCIRNFKSFLTSDAHDVD